MYNIEKSEYKTKNELYENLNMSLNALITDEKDWLANLANASSLLWMMMDDINWAGFYLYKGGELVLGPFQGKPACTHIQLGKGVCGTTAYERKTLVVPDVHKFPGHIACDSDSNSEIVVPIISGDRLLGVLDIDSPLFARFDGEDEKYLEDFVHILVRYLNCPEEFI